MTIDLEPPEGTAGNTLDEARVEAFAERLFELYIGGLLTYMIDLGHRTGLFEAAAEGPATSEELAGRAGLTERYVREWLGALVTGEIVDYDPESRRYTLPAEHAACLTGNDASNLAPMSLINALLAKTLGAVSRAFWEGGGVPYDDFRPEFTDVLDALGRGTYDEFLVEGLLPLTGELPALLADGVRVADVGCGTGHTTNLMARAYPRSTFVGYDLIEDSIGRGRAEAAEYGLANASFEVLDVTRLPAEPPFGAVFAFDAVHDQVDPVTVLDRIHQALVPGGVFVMVDIKASSNLQDNVGNPLAPWVYSVSTLHCMTVSLAHGGAGLGTAWGEQLARRMLAEAGFVDVEVHDVPGDPLNSVYVARKQAA